MLNRIAGWSLVVLLLGGLCLFVFRTKPQPAQSFRMSDGSVVTLVGVTYGKNQTLVWGKPYQRALYKILPAAWKSRSGARVFNCISLQTNVPVFWLLVSSQKTNWPPLIPFLNPVRFSLRVLDEWGCEYDARGSMLMAFVSKNETLFHPQVNPGDPHGKIIGLCIHEAGDKEQHSMRFLVPGAELPGIPSSRQPLAPPRQAGDTSVEITSLVTGLKAEPSLFRIGTNEALLTQATFHVTKNGMAVTNWQPFIPFTVRVMDAQGRPILPLRQVYGERDGDVVYNFEGVLDPAHGPYAVNVNSMRFESVPVTVSTNASSKN